MMDSYDTSIESHLDCPPKYVFLLSYCACITTESVDVCENEPGLVAYFAFDTTFKDISCNQYDATAIGK